MANNERSRAAAKKALDAYRELPGFDGFDEETSIVDLIADLLNYAEAQEYDAEAIAIQAAGHFEAERDEDDEPLGTIRTTEFGTFEKVEPDDDGRSWITTEPKEIER